MVISQRKTAQSERFQWSQSVTHLFSRGWKDGWLCFRGSRWIPDERWRRFGGKNNANERANCRTFFLLLLLCVGASGSGFCFAGGLCAGKGDHDTMRRNARSQNSQGWHRRLSDEARMVSCAPR